MSFREYIKSQETESNDPNDPIDSNSVEEETTSGDIATVDQKLNLTRREVKNLKKPLKKMLQKKLSSE